MNDQDRKAFAELLTATIGVYDKPIDTQTISIWWGSLARYSLAQVRAALSAHVQDTVRGVYAPKPADIIGKIQSADGRMGVEEAWAHVAHAIGSQAVTLVLTDEMRQAFFVADALADDTVAARMAFKETYAKALQEVRDLGRAVHWTAVLGHDAAGRETAVNEAVRLGRIDLEHAQTLLPYRAEPAPAVRALIEQREVGN